MDMYTSFTVKETGRSNFPEIHTRRDPWGPWLEQARVALCAAHLIDESGIVPRRPQSEIRMEQVCARYGCTPQQVRGGRSYRWRQPRMELMYLLHHVDGLHSRLAARAAGKSDHTTALHAVQRYMELQEMARGMREPWSIMTGIDLSKVIPEGAKV